MMLSEELKEKTKINHQLLEKKLVTRIKAIRTKQDYQGILAIFYGFFGNLEKVVDQHIDLSLLPDYPQRRKTAELAADLLQLGTVSPTLPSVNVLPPVTNHLQALGALYVMEGSTLGGKYISRMISQQLNLPEMTGLSFFNGYKDQTDSMWQLFKASLDQPLPRHEADIVIQAADDTFIQFSHWFDQHAV